MPTILLSYTLYLPNEKRTGIKKVKGCKDKTEALKRFKRELESKYKDIVKVEF